MSGPSRRWVLALLAGSGLLTGQPTPAAQPVPDELTFAEGLVALGFPDYAEKVVDVWLKAHPESRVQAAPVKIKALTSRGKFDDAEALVKALPPDSAETLAMRLTLADMFYAWGRIPKARALYDDFFRQFPHGPPAELARFFGESAYKYAQMLINVGDTAGAVQAYRLVLISKPGDDIERGVKTELAEWLFKLGEKADGEARRKAFDETRTLCQEIQWGGPDVAFGKTVVIMAHLALVNGDAAGARKIINDYLPLLKGIDEALKQDREALRYSPMAQCKFMLATLGETELRARVEQAGQANTREIKELAAQTLGSYYTVLINYPSSPWAGEAGMRGEALAEYLRLKGLKVTPPRAGLAGVVETQLKEARSLLQQQDYDAAAERYRAVLNLVPDFPGQVTALGDLVRCYVLQKDYLCSRAITGYLVERYSRASTNLADEAGHALLAVAQAYDDTGDKALAAEVTRQFIAAFPQHRRVASTLFRCGETYLQAENYHDASAFYARIVKDYARERIYVDALNRLAYCHVMTGAFSNALPLLAEYVRELSPGPDQVSARLRLADALRLSDQLGPALDEYARVATSLTREPAAYGTSPEDAARNGKALEKALFWKALCYSKLKQPADQVMLYQRSAIDGFTDFLARFPRSDLAPSALSALGTLYFIQGRPEEADKAYRRIEREYPGAPQAQNTAFAQIDSLIKLARPDEAVKAFDKMLANPSRFRAAQFQQVGALMLEAGQYSTAVRAFEEARALVLSQLLPEAEKRAVLEPALLGLGRAYAALGKPEPAAGALEDLLTRYTNTGYKVEASFVLSRACSEMGAGEPDAAKRRLAFNRAIRALNSVRLLAGREPDVRARADFETARVQRLQGDRQEAQASYQRLLLLADMGDPKVVPWIEKAVEEGIPLVMELGRFDDAVELCELYLKNLPQGRLAERVRQWRDQARLKPLSVPASASPVPGGGGG